jgi:peptide/nickel transport system substrate-binding protein
LNTWPTVELQTHLQPHRYLAVFFNTPLYDKNVRQALSYGMQKPTDNTRAIGPISPTSWAYFEGSKNYQYDLDRAIERLMDRPETLPETGIEIELTTTPSFENEANAIKDQWEFLGREAQEFCLGSDVADKSVCDRVLITVSVRISPFPDVNNFQALLIGQESPADPDQYDLWHSSRPSNFTKFSNARIDNLLEKGRQTADRNERLAIYQEFQQFFLEDAPAVFIRYLDSYEVKRK